MKKPITDTDRLNWFEAVAKRGGCPALLNDDNGHWAISFTGVQSLACGPKTVDVSTSFWVKAKDWKKTARQAIDAAMKKDAKP